MYRVLIHVPDEQIVEYLTEYKASAFNHARRYILKAEMVQIYNEDGRRIYMHAKPRNFRDQRRAQ